jgi:hypothetical protein
MAIDTNVPQSRRALLAAAVGAGAATVAAALGRPLPARAGVDGDVVLSAANYSSATTTIQNHNASFDVFAVYSTYANAIVAEADQTAVNGHSANGVAVLARSNNKIAPAAVGWSGWDGTGVTGYSNDAYVTGWTGLPAPPAKTGVYGRATQDAGSRGVHGYSTAGRGVFGQSTSGQGVRGYATSGTAGYFASADPGTGYALRAIGRVKLDTCAGVATIKSGAKSKTVSPGIDLVSTSAVVATLQNSAGGTTTVHRCVVSTTANTFTIYLTANATQDCRVAWHVFG